MAASGSLRVIDSSTEPLSLHPRRSFDQYSDAIISQMYEGLLDYDSQGRLVPKLAVRWQKLSPIRYRFHLRKGVAFHDGEPFNAETVAFSVARRRQPAVANSLMFNPGLRAEVIDQYTVDLVMDRPYARIPSTLTSAVRVDRTPWFRSIAPRCRSFFLRPNYLVMSRGRSPARSPVALVVWKRRIGERCFSMRSAR